MSTALFNGKAVTADADALLRTRALHYGDGVFRTVLVVDGRVADRECQLDTLAADAEALDLEADRAALDADIDALLAAHGRGALRITLSRAAGARGYRPDTRRADRLLQLSALPPYAARCWAGGVDVGWSRVLLGVQPRLAGIKHLNRLEQVLASREMPADRHEVLMCDAEGRVTCGTRSNLFLVIDNALVTPDLTLAGVAGMMRRKLISLARRHGLPCEVGLISPDEVRHASEGFLSNSLIGIWPIRRLGSLEWPAPGPWTRSMIEHLQHPWSGA